MNTEIIIWDESSLIDERSKELREAGLAETTQEAIDMAVTDSELLECEFEDFKGQFSSILSAISPEGFFYVQGRNMGWRRLSGELELQAQDAAAFIRKAFPQTNEWCLRGTYNPAEKILEYTLYHHDAPTGEFYTVKAGLADST